MKQCPICKSSYTDDSLQYCLSDGSALVNAPDDERTFVRGPDEPIRVTISEPAQPTAVLPRQQQPTRASAGGAGTFLKVAAVLLGLGLLLVVVLGVAGLLYYNYSTRTVAVSNSNLDQPNRSTPSVSPSPAPTVDDTEDLRRQLDNLEKILKQQQSGDRPANIPLSLPNQTTTTTARVNSPGDGFLALRTFPSSEVGDRILKIPHGATITIGGCINASRVGGKTGRWCRASYNGYSGWVFDAFLVY